MNLLLLTILIFITSGCTFKIIDYEDTISAQKTRPAKEVKLDITATMVEEKPDIAAQAATRTIATLLGGVYVGMPKEDLKKVGYGELTQKDYRKEGHQEWITYLNWANLDSDLVTFYIVDGKVKGWKEE